MEKILSDNKNYVYQLSKLFDNNNIKDDSIIKQLKKIKKENDNVTIIFNEMIKNYKKILNDESLVLKEIDNYQIDLL